MPQNFVLKIGPGEHYNVATWEVRFSLLGRFLKYLDNKKRKEKKRKHSPSPCKLIQSWGSHLPLCLSLYLLLMQSLRRKSGFLKPFLSIYIGHTCGILDSSGIPLVPHMPPFSVSCFPDCCSQNVCLQMFMANASCEAALALGTLGQVKQSQAIVLEVRLTAQF